MAQAVLTELDNAIDGAAGPVEVDAARKRGSVFYRFMRGPSVTDGMTRERFPFFIRAYGIVCMVSGVLQILVFGAGLVLLVRGEQVFTAEQASTATSLGITIAESLLSVALSLMFIILGTRLLRGDRRKAAVLASVMILLESLVLFCQIMLAGFALEELFTLVNIVVLAILQTYADPNLVGERWNKRQSKEREHHEMAETSLRERTASQFIPLNYFNLFWVFVICSVLGLGIECVFHMIYIEPGVYQDRAGFLYGPFSPIYGLGGVVMTLVLNRTHKTNIFAVFFISAVCGAAFEFLVSWFLQMAFGISAWDYTGEFLSIDGRTDGLHMVMWGVLGIVWVKMLMPLMLKLVNIIPWNWRYAVSVVCTALMIADAVLTLAAVDCWYQRAAGRMDYENTSAIAQMCNKYYDDAFMEGRFESMSLDVSSAARL